MLLCVARPSAVIVALHVFLWRCAVSPQRQTLDARHDALFGDFSASTPTAMTTAISDMELAFADAASRAPDLIELGAGNVGGLTLTPGVYQWSSGVSLPSQTILTLSGNSSDVFVFQVEQNLTIANGTNVVLQGVQASNVFCRSSAPLRSASRPISRAWSCRRRASRCARYRR